MARGGSAGEFHHAGPTSAVVPLSQTEASRPRADRYKKSNWRVWLVRVPANGLAVALTALVLPGIHVTTSRPVLGYLVVGADFGLLNAIVKPAFKYVALPFLLA